MSEEIRKDIDPFGTGEDLIILLAEGNIGALNAITRLVGHTNGDLDCLVSLDDMNLRGSMLYVAFAYHCQGDVAKFAECIKRRSSAMVERVNTEIKRGAGGHYLAVERGALAGNRPRLPDDWFERGFERGEGR